MSRSQSLWVLFCAVVLCLWLAWAPAAGAADKDAGKQAGKVAGILSDKHEDSITVKADGEDDPVKYVVGQDKRVARALQGIFNASRVQLTYKKDGDSRQLTSI